MLPESQEQVLADSIKPGVVINNYQNFATGVPAPQQVPVAETNGLLSDIPGPDQNDCMCQIFLELHFPSHAKVFPFEYALDPDYGMVSVGQQWCLVNRSYIQNPTANHIESSCQFLIEGSRMEISQYLKQAAVRIILSYRHVTSEDCCTEISFRKPLNQSSQHQNSWSKFVLRATGSGFEPHEFTVTGFLKLSIYSRENSPLILPNPHSADSPLSVWNSAQLDCCQQFLENHLVGTHPKSLEINPEKTGTNVAPCGYMHNMLSDPFDNSVPGNEIQYDVMLTETTVANGVEYVPTHRPISNEIKFNHSAGGGFLCSVGGCSQRFNSRSSLSRHKRKVHFPDNLPKCHHCFQVFTRPYMLSRHLDKGVCPRSKAQLAESTKDLSQPDASP